MPFYYNQGHIPPKRHTVYKKSDGSLYYEELISREGFSYMYSNLYHLQMPTKVKKVGDFVSFFGRVTSCIYRSLISLFVTAFPIQGNFSSGSTSEKISLGMKGAVVFGWLVGIVSI